MFDIRAKFSYNIFAYYCGAEQKGLDLKETKGSVVCSKCEKQFNAKSDEFKNQKNEDETAE